MLKRRLTFLIWAGFAAWGGYAAESIAPAAVLKLDSRARSVAWLDSTHLLVARPDGVRLLAIADNSWSDVIAGVPAPDGVREPMTVSTDGSTVVATNAWERSEFGCRISDKKRLFARSGPFQVFDMAVSGKTLYVMGWPIGPRGANNPQGVAVWKGGISPYFDQFQPLHRIESGGESVQIFNDTLPTYGGSLAIEPNGDVDVLTPAEAGVFQYTADGKLRHHLGTRLGELVVHRMTDINFRYGADEAGRYREIVNRQPFADDLVVTPDGPAIVVRLARNDRIEWELWYPNAERLDRRVKLGISRRGPFGHISCDARGHELACVYQSPETAEAALRPDQRSAPAYLVRFHLPAYRQPAIAAVRRK